MKRIAVLTSGGDAPGMNAAVRAVTRTAIYAGMDVIGVRRGYEGLLDGDVIPMTRSSVVGIILRGGTMLRTARCERFMRPEAVREGVTRLREYDIDALVVIGGDGSYRGAYELHKLGFPTVGIPGTIDNDIAGTDCTIGFDTACNTALGCIEKLRDTASSHERLFVVEVMGRRAGYLALEVGVAAGAEYVLIPENPFDIEKLYEHIRYARERGKTHSMIVLAEGVMPASELAAKLHEAEGLEAKITVLGHIQRGGSPSCFDVVLASRLGNGAVEALLAGKSGVQVGRIAGKIETCPLPDAWNQKKPLDADMMALVEKLSI